MTRQIIAPAQRAAILKIAKKYGVKNIRVFGSVARGEAGPKSDLDLLIDMEKHSLRQLVGFKLDVEDALGKGVDVVEACALHWYIRDKVLGEARPL